MVWPPTEDPLVETVDQVLPQSESIVEPAESRIDMYDP